MNTAAAQSYRLKRALVLASAECDRLTFITLQSSSGTRPAINTNCQTIKPHTLTLAAYLLLLRYLHIMSILTYNFQSFCLLDIFLWVSRHNYLRVVFLTLYKAYQNCYMYLFHLMVEVWHFCGLSPADIISCRAWLSRDVFKIGFQRQIIFIAKKSCLDKQKGDCWAERWTTDNFAGLVILPRVQTRRRRWQEAWRIGGHGYHQQQHETGLYL